MTSPIAVQIDLDALRHNFTQLKKLARRSRVMAMVKGNGYGHGMLSCAKALPNADGFGVARLNEAVALRQAGITQRILVTTGYQYAHELQQLAHLHCDIALHHDHQITLLNQTPLTSPVTVWIKVNTGLNRLGFAPEAIHPLYHYLKQLPMVQTIHFFSHLADAIKPATTQHQYHCFMQATAGLKGERSLAKSASIIQHTHSHLDWIRPGILLYGISPLPGQYGKDFCFRPVMTLSSQLIAIRFQQAGDAIGYEGNWACPEAMPIGIVAIGYGDGYPGFTYSGIPTHINGQCCPTISRIAMDMIIIDLRRYPQAKIGDRVTLWGPSLPVEMVVQHTGFPPHDILTRIGQRQANPIFLGRQHLARKKCLTNCSY